MEFRIIKKNIINWMKKIACNTDLDTKKNSVHCHNFATRCCITCNRCWIAKEKD